MRAYELRIFLTADDQTRLSVTCSTVLQNYFRPAAEMLQNCFTLTADYQGTISRYAANFKSLGHTI